MAVRPGEVTGHLRQAGRVHLEATRVAHPAVDVRLSRRCTVTRVGVDRLDEIAEFVGVDALEILTGIRIHLHPPVSVIKQVKVDEAEAASMAEHPPRTS